MSNYVTNAALKATLELTGTTYADDDITVAIEAASRCVDGYKGDRFFPTQETRYYTTSRYDTSVGIDSLNQLLSLRVDLDGSGAYATTWSNGTQFYLDPINAPSDGVPYRRVVLRELGGGMFPAYENGVKVFGSFGWATTPAGVVEATSILASRFLKRARETPYGILAIVGDSVAAATRLGRIDPDVALLLSTIPGTSRQPIRSLTLG